MRIARETSLLPLTSWLKLRIKLVTGWLLGTLIVLAAGWAFLLTSLDREKLDAERAAFAKAELTSKAYAVESERVLEMLDRVTLHLKYEWILTDGNIDLFQLRQQGLIPSNSDISISFVNRDGFRVSDTENESPKDPKDISLTTRPFFTALKEAPNDYLFIGTTSMGVISNLQKVRVARRITDPAGRFDGVVLIAINPKFLLITHDSASLGKNGLLGLVGQDQVIRLLQIGDRIHSEEAPLASALPTFRSQNGHVLLEGKQWFDDKQNRLIAWQGMQKYPLIAVVGLDESEALAPYWKHRADASRSAQGVSIGFVVFALVAMVLSTRLSWRKYQLKLAQETYRMATEEGEEGFYIFRSSGLRKGEVGDFEIVDCNVRGAAFFQRSKTELKGLSLSYLKKHYNLDPLLSFLQGAKRNGFCEGELGMILSGAQCWFHVKAIQAEQDVAVTLLDTTPAKFHVQELERRSNEDHLTLLPNRKWVLQHLQDAVERAKGQKQILAVLHVGLDGFKTVNDTLGHAAGDELLLQAAHRLKVAIRPQDHVARVGGDEFAVIVEDIRNKDDAADAADRVIFAFKEKFKLQQSVHAIGVSIGISLYPNDGIDAEALLKNADIGMYAVKSSSKGSYRFYDRQFHEALCFRIDTENELRHAIERDEFIIYYQPRIDIRTGELCSMESLIRWQHPTRGLIQPLEFISIAEDSDLVLDIGEIVIEKVCAQLAIWKKENHRSIPVSVNVSPRQINHADVPHTLMKYLSRYNVVPELIEVEVTESSMIGDSDSVSQTLKNIQAMGIKILVDDFGTGYSSLAQLQSLDFDVLKIDRSFISKLEKTQDGEIFVNAIITMAHALNMRVVAEGVENATQIARLQSMSCDEVQGFYISRPVPAEDVHLFRPKSLMIQSASQD